MNKYFAMSSIEDSLKYANFTVGELIEYQKGFNAANPFK
jgi:hypothetical protein